MLCVIGTLYNFKNVKNTHGGVLLVILLKVSLLRGCFHVFYIVQIMPNRAKRLICNTAQKM